MYRRQPHVDCMGEMFVQDIANDKLNSAAGQQKLKVYCGFDPTAASLHIGNLLGIIVLRWFQLCGHDTVALLGELRAVWGILQAVFSPHAPPSNPSLLHEAQARLIKIIVLVTIS